MSEVLRRRVEEVFQEVADLPPEERGAFLDERCPDEDELRAEVESPPFKRRGAIQYDHTCSARPEL